MVNITDEASLQQEVTAQHTTLARPANRVYRFHDTQMTVNCSLHPQCPEDTSQSSKQKQNKCFQWPHRRPRQRPKRSAPDERRKKERKHKAHTVHQAHRSTTAQSSNAMRVAFTSALWPAWRRGGGSVHLHLSGRRHAATAAASLAAAGRILWSVYAASPCCFSPEGQVESQLRWGSWFVGRAREMGQTELRRV